MSLIRMALLGRRKDSWQHGVLLMVLCTPSTTFLHPFAQDKLGWHLGQDTEGGEPKGSLSDRLIRITTGETLPFPRTHLLVDVKCKLKRELGNLVFSCGSTTNGLYSWQVTSPSGSHVL